MSISRRDFVRLGSMGAAGTLWLGSDAARIRADDFFTRSPEDPVFRDLCMAAVNAASMAGASYADVRIDIGRTRETDMDDADIDGLYLGTQYRVGVRALSNGGWGFASSTVLTTSEVTRVAQLAVRQGKANPYAAKHPVTMAPAAVVRDGVWQTPIKVDAFTKSFDEQLEIQAAAHAAAMKVKKSGMEQWVASYIIFSMNDQHFASTDGTYTVQRFYAFGPDIYVEAYYGDNTGYGNVALSGGAVGWEGWAVPNLSDQFGRAMETAYELATATPGTVKPVDPGRYDVVFDGNTIGNMLGLNVGRALQIDRCMDLLPGGVRSYLGPLESKVGQFDYRCPLLTLRGSRSITGTGALTKWDDEGVAPDDFTLLQNGVVMDYITTREHAPALAAWYERQKLPMRSHGCARASGADAQQTVADPTLIMSHATQNVSTDELIAGVKRGVYFSEGSTYLNMDASLLNFSISPNSASVYEIRDGKIGTLLQDVQVMGRTLDFWHSLDAVGGETTVRRTGYPVGKQGITSTAIAPAGRVRQLNVVNSGRRV